jgi:DNA-binding protein HU-beta
LTGRFGDSFGHCSGQEIQFFYEMFRFSGTIWLSATRRMGESMTQTQLIQTLADKCEITKKNAKDLLTTLSEIAISEVKKNGVFVVPGLGRLVRVDRKARMGRNPATGESIKIPAKKVVKFRIAKAAKDAIVPAKAKKVA